MTPVLDLMTRLTEAFGVSGFEDEIRSVIREEVADLVDETRVDVLGNLVARRAGLGGGKRLMLAAHMDQIGLIVTHVDQRGFLRFTQVGFLWALACWGAQVKFRDGTVGTIGLDGRAKPRTELPSWKEMLVDVGATGREDVTLKPGDVAVFWRPFMAQGDAWFAPNLDDRIGCAVLIELLRRIKGRPIAHDVYAVFTTQEEVGPRGAVTSAYAIQPDIALAVDVTMTGDMPHANPAMEVKLAGGPAIKVQDSGMISHPGLNGLLIAAAEAANVPYQLEVLAGGTTDAHSIQVSREGVPTSVVSIPSRHVHTPSQIVDARDAEGAVRLLEAFLEMPLAL
jgi:endoglucanase